MTELPIALTIRLDDLSHPAIHALLEEHLDSMRSISPPDSVHALDLDGLRADDITFWSAWQGDQLLGCAALKQLSLVHGEIKSMRISASQRRKGVARALLEHIVNVAGTRQYELLSLETGSMAEFIPARTLYASVGFTYCGPFANYVEDSNSTFMHRRILMSNDQQQ